MIYINRLRRGCAEMAQSSASLALFTSRPSPPCVNENPSSVLCAGSNESPQLCHLLPTPRLWAVLPAGPTWPGTACQTQRQIVKEHTRVTAPTVGSGEWGRVWTTLLPTQVSGNKARARPAPPTHRTPSSVGTSPQGWVAQSQSTPVAPLPLP